MRGLRSRLLVIAAGWVATAALVVRLAWGGGTAPGMEWALHHLPTPIVAWGAVVLAGAVLIPIGLVTRRVRSRALTGSAALSISVVALGAWLFLLGHESGAAISIVGAGTAVASHVATRLAARASG